MEYRVTLQNGSMDKVLGVNTVTFNAGWVIFRDGLGVVIEAFYEPGKVAKVA